MSGRINFMSIYQTKQRVRAGEKLSLTSANNINRNNITHTLQQSMQSILKRRVMTILDIS